MDSRHSVNIITLKQRHPSRAEYFILVLLDPSVVSNGSFTEAVNSTDACGLTLSVLGFRKVQLGSGVFDYYRVTTLEANVLFL